MRDATAEEMKEIVLPPGFEGAKVQVFEPGDPVPEIEVDADVQETVSALPTQTQDLVKAQWAAARQGMMDIRKGVEIDLDGKERKRQRALVEEDIVKYTIKTLEGMGGKFFVDATPHIFLPSESAVYRFHDDDEAYRLLKRFGLLLTQPDYKLAKENLHGIILASGKKTHIEKFGCIRGDAVYINAGRDIIKITDGATLEESFTRVANGTDDVYMLNKHLTEWPVLDFDQMQKIDVGLDGKGGKVTDSKLCQFLNAYFEESKLTSVQYQQLVILRYLSLFLGVGVIDLRPIMLASGVQNSGKSTLWEKIMWLFYGVSYESGAMPTKLRDFLSKITNHQVLLFDNIDRADFGNVHTDYPTFMDLMCKSSTGGTVSLAQLYKNNVDRNYKLRCDLFLTSRVNPFPSEASDIQRRIITLPIRPPTAAEHKTTEAMKREFLAAEQEIKLETLLRLRLVLKALIAYRGREWKPESEMASFETYTMQVSAYEGWHDEMIAIWQGFATESRQRTAEDSPIINLIRCWLGRPLSAGGTNVGRWARGGEIYKDLAELYGRKFTSGFRSDAAFGRKLKSNASALSVLKIQKKLANGSWTYCFDPPTEQLAQCRDAFKDSPRDDFGPVLREIQPDPENLGDVKTL